MNLQKKLFIAIIVLVVLYLIGSLLLENKESKLEQEKTGAVPVEVQISEVWESTPCPIA